MTREEAKEYIKKHLLPNYRHGSSERELALNWAIYALEQPEPRWTLVTEELPKKADYYACTMKDSQVKIVWYSVYFHEFEIMGVIAWMPLPKPFNNLKKH